MLLSTMREKPRSRASACDVDRVAGAGNRARTERQRVGLAPGGAEPIEVAPERRRVREEEVRDQHRLRRTEVRERRHQRVARPCAAWSASAAITCAHQPLQQRDAAPQIEAQIERDLLVARPAGVQPPAGVAEPLDQQPLDEAVDVLVRRRSTNAGSGAATLEQIGERRFDAPRARRCRARRRAPARAPRPGCR